MTSRFHQAFCVAMSSALGLWAYHLLPPERLAPLLGVCIHVAVLRYSSPGRMALLLLLCLSTQIEELGDMDAAAAKVENIQYRNILELELNCFLPSSTLPKINFQAPPIYGFITDGLIEDLSDVQQYSLSLAQQIADGKRNFVKLVLIGVGQEVDEGQMEALDDLDYGGIKGPDGQKVDLWATSCPPICKRSKRYLRRLCLQTRSRCVSRHR